MRRTFDPFRLLLISIAGWMGQQQRYAIDYLREENRVLREQLGGKRLRRTDGQRRRLAARARRLGRRLLREVATIVAPILLAWHRKLIANKYDGTRQRGPGRPRTRDEIEDLVVCMATENRNWGYRRIQGALANLGHEVARNTIANVLREHGLEPAPECNRKTTWREFLSRHWVKESCLDWMILFGEGSLRKATHEFVEHYHRERNHQGLSNRLIIPEPSPAGAPGAIRRRQRLGGMLNYYYRQAA
jgi:hypothetical protein